MPPSRPRTSNFSASAPPASTAASSASANVDAAMASMEQRVAEDKDCHRHVNSNRQKILVETLDLLKRELVQIRSDDWMFEKPRNQHGADSSASLSSHYYSKPF